MTIENTSKNLSLAIKHRPRSLKTVIGQDLAVQKIRGMVAAKTIPPTILLAGPYSTGKTTLARLIALYANCEKLTSKGEPCRKCDSCKAMRAVILGNGTHPDVKEIDAADKRKIEDMRDLQEQAQYAPITRYKIFILDECHQITGPAWQAALKTFEHPPGDSRFILCTTEPEKLPTTIRSRATKFILQPISPSLTAQLLRRVGKKEGLDLTKKTRQEIAGVVNGHPRDALILLESVVNYVKTAGKSVDIKKHLPQILRESDAAKPYLASQDYVSALFSLNLSQAFKAVNSVENHTSFIDQIILILHLLLISWVDKSLTDRSKFWAVKNVQHMGRQAAVENIQAINEVLKLLLVAQTSIKSYTVDSNAVLESTAIDAIEIGKSTWGKKRKTE